jgi:hypothetical protein
LTLTTPCHMLLSFVTPSFTGTRNYET